MSAFKSAFGGMMGVFAAIGACIAIIGLTFLFLCGGCTVFLGNAVDKAAVRLERENQAARQNPVVVEEARVEEVKREFRAREVNPEPAADEVEPVAVAPNVGKPPAVGGERAKDPLGNDLSEAESSLLGVEKQKPAAADRTDEQKAQSLLSAAKAMLSGNKKAGEKRLKEIVDKYPETNAAKEAAKLLK